jgi:quercetin dioxygenase-like cupin family protein
MTGRADSTVLIDNERVRATRWHFEPGAATGWHRHEYDYVVVPLTDGTLRLVEPDGDTHSDLRAGAPYFREIGVEHDVINANDHEFTFIEIEMKR